jgi:UDP-glucose 4-epimerase
MVNRFLVTGGAGFIGSHMVDRLVRKGCEVVVLDDFSSGSQKNLGSHIGKSNFRLIKGDVRNKTITRRALENVDAVFHFAAIVNVDFSVKNPLLVNEVNVKGTLNLLESCLKSKVKQFIYVSSCAVYGEPEYFPIDESHPTRPLSPYGVSKLAAEHYCQVFCRIHGFKTVILRYFNVYGPRQSKGPYSGVISKFTEQLRQKKVPVIFGDGTQTRDFVYVDDVVNATLKVLDCKKCAGEVINVGSGKETSIRELYNILLKIFGMRNVKPKYCSPRAGDIKRSYADLGKAEKLLRYKPKFSIEDGLRKLLAEQDKE